MTNREFDLISIHGIHKQGDRVIWIHQDSGVHGLSHSRSTFIRYVKGGRVKIETGDEIIVPRSQVYEWKEGY